MAPFFLIILFLQLHLHNISSAKSYSSSGFQFPDTKSQVIPNPSDFFSPKLISSPLPTNSFFQNFVIGDGDEPEYIHPYLVKTSNSSLFVSFPSVSVSSSIVSQIFVPDLTISSLNKIDSICPNRTHLVRSFSDFGVILDIPANNLRFYLIRGSPYLTFLVRRKSSISISTVHAILSLSSDDSLSKHVVKLDNSQTWLLYTSVPVHLAKKSVSQITISCELSGFIRLAFLPDSGSKTKAILDRFSSCYPVSGSAVLAKSGRIQYKWETRGSGTLLLLAHPLHRKLLSGKTLIMKDLKYKSIDGELVGIIGDSWMLKVDQIPINWHSIKGIKKKFFPEIVSALKTDVSSLNLTQLSVTSSSYFYGKLIARAARLALIAEEVCFPEAIPSIVKFLRKGINPWLDGKFKENGFLYEKQWGGLITKLGSSSTTADFGFGIYNDHHFHLGYFVYAIAVLAKIDPEWGIKYKPKAYALVSDYMNNYTYSTSTRLRNFDLWKLHSWAAGLTPFPNGRNQESTSEAMNAYYSAALMGLAYKDNDLITIGSTLAALEIQSAQTWWHVKNDENSIYEKEFRKENRFVGILWANMRDSKLWFAPAEWRECRLGIQVLPILPITETLFSDENFAREAVEWTLPALDRSGGVGEGWKGFLYALEGIYDEKNALKKIRKLKGFDDGNSYANLLWWVHSR